MKEKVEMTEVTRYAWKCTLCGGHNIEELYFDNVECQDCCEEYDVNKSIDCT